MPDYLKKEIRLPEGFRFISEDDVDRPFKTGDERMDMYTLRDYYAWSKQPNHLVIVYEKGGKVAGVMDVTVHEDHLFVEMLGRNVLVAASGVGTRLMSLVENIARQLKKRDIRLESLDSAVMWYNQKLGYEEYDKPYYDEEFGQLTPKKKPLR